MPELTVVPVTSERWADLEKLFGPNGAYAGCWCMWWRLKRSEFERSTRDERKDGLKELVDSDQPPGILAYHQGQPIAWVSIAPRETYPSLERSRTLRRVDEEPVWSIVCFFVAKAWRRKGLMVDLLHGVVSYAASQGATIVEGYPSDPPEGQEVQGGVTGYMGMASAFRKAGFVEVARPSEKRPVMRFYVAQAW
jgi:GNAT superfamily N-acetyltransferase